MSIMNFMKDPAKNIVVDSARPVIRQNMIALSVPSSMLKTTMVNAK